MRRVEPHVSGMVMLILALNACGSSLDDDARVPTDTLRVSDTVVTTASALIGGVADLAVGPDGRVFILDHRSHRILSIRPDGTDPRMFGREGEGPGEFNRARELSVGADRVWVYDRGLGRVQAFEPDGDVVGAYAVDAPRISGRASLDAHGRLALPMGGHDSVMVAVLDSAGERVAAFGEPIVPATSFFDFVAINATIDEGRIPDAMRNNAQVISGSDGSVWLVFDAEPEVRRYAANGRLLWSTRLDGPAIEMARDSFFHENMADPRVAFYQTLSYVADAAAISGKLWLLLEAPVNGSGILLVIEGEHGRITHRFLLGGIENADDIAVDAQRGRLYFSLGGVAAIAAADLPD